MECATVKDGDVVAGIKVTKNDERPAVVCLGRKGSGNKFAVVSIDRKSKGSIGLIKNGFIYDAYVFKRTKRIEDLDTGEIEERTKTYLSHSRNKCFKRIVVVDTATDLIEKKRIDGEISERACFPERVAFGWSYGSRRRSAHEMWVLDDMDAISVTQAGGGREFKYVLSNQKGDLIISSELEYVKYEKERERLYGEHEDDLKRKKENLAKKQTSGRKIGLPKNIGSVSQVRDSISRDQMIELKLVGERSLGETAKASFHKKKPLSTLSNGLGDSLTDEASKGKQSKMDGDGSNIRNLEKSSSNPDGALDAKPDKQTVIHDEPIERVKS